MTPIKIEGVIITPKILESLKYIQNSLLHYTDTADNIIDHLLKDSDKVTVKEKFQALQSTHYLKQYLLSLVPEGGEE